MSKLKKIITSIIITLMAILGISTISNGYYVGQVITKTYNDYISDSNLYCAQHGQSLLTER